MSLYIIDGRNDGYPCVPEILELPEISLVPPIPSGTLLVSPYKNHGYPSVNKLGSLPDEVVLAEPYPDTVMIVLEDYNDGYPCIPALYGGREVLTAGAFKNATSLEYVYIPRTVQKIGRYAFAGTALKSVTIPTGCQYYETSFPENCEINFY